MKAVLPALARPLLAHRLPPDVDVAWFMTAEEAKRAIADAEIAWVDMRPTALVAETIRAGGDRLKWVSTIYAGLDAFPVDWLRTRGVTVTNGIGINAHAVAEYAIMGVLAAAKRFDVVLRAQDARQWLPDAPGKTELPGTRALVIGYGAIGRLVGRGLEGLGVEVVGVTRSGGGGTLTPELWRDDLFRFDWVILAAPSTSNTKAMIGASELAAFKPTAWLVNVARGDMVDQDELVDALQRGTIGGAFLDPTDPEPLPADHPLWTAPNCMITMHLSGLSQTGMFHRAADLFVENLQAFRAGDPMRNVANLDLGY